MVTIAELFCRHSLLLRSTRDAPDQAKLVAVCERGPVSLIPLTWISVPMSFPRGPQYGLWLLDIDGRNTTPDGETLPERFCGPGVGHTRICTWNFLRKHDGEGQG